MRILSLALIFLGCFAVADDYVAEFRFESAESLSTRLKLDGAILRSDNPGPLLKPAKLKNTGSVEFDGTASIVATELPSNAEGLVHNFTWEGFFIVPGSHSCDADGAVGDRFLSSFLDENGGSTRLTIGLSMRKGKEQPYLSIALASTTNHHVGRLSVVPDMWHHFALVHQGTGTDGVLKWYLDYELAGEVHLTGKSTRETLPPAGAAPFQIGARLKAAGKADRGFQGSLDEIRLTARALEPTEFSRVKEVVFDRDVMVQLFDELPDEFNWDFDEAVPTESLTHEAVSLAGLPPKFSPRGFPGKREGASAMNAVVSLALPENEYEILFRTSVESVLTVDGKPLIDTRRVSDNHPLGKLPSTQRDYSATFVSDGSAQQFTLSALFAAEKQNDAHDVIVIYSPTGAEQWRLLGHPADAAIGPAAWAGYRGRLQKYYRSIESDRRQAAIERGNRFWNVKHQQDREFAASWRVDLPSGNGNPIDEFLELGFREQKTQPAELVDDETFLRRATLDLLGRIPTVEEYRTFQAADDGSNKREYAIDRMLASDEWADAWVGYWQDVLAENPTILKPDLNNSGAFRWWIHDSMRRNVPMDRFATELIMMQGGDREFGTAGFAKAARNDVPMAMKAHIVVQAFLAVDMKCARCHDSPRDDLTQRDLFSLAALLNEDAIKVPSTSVVPQLPGGREPAVTSSLKPGDVVAAKWSLSDVIAESDAIDTDADERSSRSKLASIITTSKNPRFSDVIVNRTWKRLFGIGLVEPVDNWSVVSQASHPQLLRHLSWQFVDSGYDLKDLVRTIVSSRAYQRAVGDARSEDGQPTFAAQRRRRMTAEQLVDSFHTAVGKSFDSEELSFDPNKSRDFINLGQPSRAWHMTSMSNERDRPALAMPINQSIVDVMTTFGWRETRPDPLTDRDHAANPVQPLMVSNALMSQRMIRLTEDSPLTELCLEEIPVEDLVRKLFISTLSRQPTSMERSVLTELIGDSFTDRRTGKAKPKTERTKPARVDWDKHLKAEASVEIMESEKLARAGEPATIRLTEEFRERVEDALWVLVNTPEFVFVP